MQAGAQTLATKQRKPLNYGRASHLLREVEKAGFTFKHEGRTVVAHGTGATILKMVSKPVAKLVDSGAIGPEELQAASDIFHAFMAKTGNLWIGPQSWERRDRSFGSSESAASIDAQARYKSWAEHWSLMAKRGDKTLQIVIASVIDERPFYQIEGDLNIRHGLGKTATIRGLRDYAARAGWVKYQTAAQWKSDAARTFERKQ